MEYENLKDELLSTVDTGLKYARTVDTEAEFELYLFYQNKAGVSITQGDVEASEGIIDSYCINLASGDFCICVINHPGWPSSPWSPGSYSFLP